MPRLAAALILALTFAPAHAEDANLSASPIGEPGAASRLALAQRAYRVALDRGDVLALVVAIRLARGVTLRPATSWVPGQQDDPSLAEPGDGPSVPDPASDAALAMARNLAADSPDLEDLVYDLDAQLPRRQPETAITAEGSLGPGQSESWRLALSGEVAAELALIGSDQSLLSLTLTDDAGHILCATPPATDPALCRITPARNGFFTLQVRNAGGQDAGYRLVGN